MVKEVGAGVDSRDSEMIPAVGRASDTVTVVLASIHRSLLAR